MKQKELKLGKRCLYSKFKYFVLLFLIFILINISFSQEIKKTFVMFTGREHGTYFPVGQLLVNIIKKENPSLNFLCEPSNGSLDNAHLISTNRADFAIIQSDVAYYLYEGRRIFNFPYKKLRIITSLYKEVIHLVVSANSDVNQIEYLRGKAVGVGKVNSGSEFHARIILESANLSYQDIIPYYKNLDESLDLLRQGVLDAFFVTTRIPANSLAEAMEKGEIKLISIDPTHIAKIIKAHPFFKLTTINKFTYPNQSQDVTTLTVDATLVTSKNVSDKYVFQVIKSLAENENWLKDQFPFIEIDYEITKKLPLPLHSGAKKYFTPLPSYLVYLQYSPIIIILVILFYTIFKKFPEFKKFILKKIFGNYYIRFGFLLFLFLFLGALALHLAERNYNRNFLTISQSFWSCIVYLFSGFEDKSPITSAGKVISIFIFLLGVSIFGIVSGRFASYFVEITFKKEKTMPTDLKDHIIICNWNKRAEQIIHELYSANPKINITILTDADINEQELFEKDEFKNIHFARGDPAIHNRLRVAKVDEAKSVIILANEQSEDPDAQTALIALAITKISGSNKPHIVAEALNHRKIHHLYDAGVDEVICSSDYGIGLLAQSSLNPGLSEVYDRLLSYSGETNEIYVIPSDKVPSSLKDHTFSEVSRMLIEKRNSSNPVILLGIIKNKKIIINPKRGENDKIEEDDSLLVIAYTYPDLSYIT